MGGWGGFVWRGGVVRRERSCSDAINVCKASRTGILQRIYLNMQYIVM